MRHLSIPDIADRLLGEWHVDKTWNIQRPSYPKLEYKCQYGESDYVFLSRLLEEAGVAFVFPDDESSARRRSPGEAPRPAQFTAASFSAIQANASGAS